MRGTRSRAGRMLAAVAVCAAAFACVGATTPDPQPPESSDAVPIDGAALAARLHERGVVVLPGAPGKLDEAAARREMRAVRRATGTRTYVLLAPWTMPDYALQDALEGRFGKREQVVLVPGLWAVPGASLEYAGHRSSDAVYRANLPHERVALENFDVTPAVLDLLRQLRHAAPSPNPRGVTARATGRQVDEIAARWRRAPEYPDATDNRYYFDPALRLTERQRSALDYVIPRPEPGTARYRVAYLNSDPAPGHSTDLVNRLAAQFPGETVVVVRGHWVQAAGGAKPGLIEAALRTARRANFDSLFSRGASASMVGDFFDRLAKLRAGALNPRALPRQREDVGVLGTRLGAIAFTATAFGLGVLALGGWWLVRRQNRRAAARRFRLERAYAVADVARLAAGVASLRAAADDVVAGNRQAQAAERYATAVDLLERARTSRELSTARTVADEARRLLVGTAHPVAERLGTAAPGTRARPATKKTGRRGSKRDRRRARKAKSAPARRPATRTATAKAPAEAAEPPPARAPRRVLRALFDLRRPVRLIAVLGLLAALVGFGVPAVLSWTSSSSGAPMTPEARRAVAGLRSGSVYLENGGAWRLDVPAAKRLIGDRPILIAGFARDGLFDPDTEPYRDEIARYPDDKAARADGYLYQLLDEEVPLRVTCHAIADAYPDSFVEVIGPDPTFMESCTGADFPAEDGSSQDWDVGVSATAAVAARDDIDQHRLTPYVAELVGYYEQHLDQLDEAPGARILGGRYRALLLTGFIGLAVFAACALFYASRYGTARVQRYREHRRRVAGARARAIADIARLAGLLTERTREHVDPEGETPQRAQRLAELSEEYLDIAMRLEHAADVTEFESLAGAARAAAGSVGE